MTAIAWTENASFNSIRSTSARFQPIFVDQLSDGFDRRHHHQRRLDAADGLTNDSRHRFFAERGRALGRRHHYAAAPSLTPGALPAVTVPSFLNAGLRARSASIDSIGARRFVGIEQHRIAFALGNRDGNDFVPETVPRELQRQLCDGC